MQSASKIQSLAVHLITHPHIHHPIRIFLHILAVLQIIVSIVPQQSHIYIILHWLDPSTFVQPTILAASALLTMSILVALVLWKLVTGAGNAQKVSIEQQYVSNLILHLQLVLRSILYVPLLKISISTLVNGEENFLHVISIVNMAFFLILILPFHLILFSYLELHHMLHQHHLKYHQSLQQIHLLEHLFQKYDHSFHQIFV